MNANINMQEIQLNLFRILNAEGPTAVSNWLDTLSPPLSEESILQEIANFHPKLNIFTYLSKIKENDMRPSINLVLAAAKLVKSNEVEDAVNLLIYVNNLDPAFHYSVEEVFEEILKDSPTKVHAVLEELLRLGIRNEAPYLLWAKAMGIVSWKESMRLIENGIQGSDFEDFIRTALFITLPTEAKKSDNYEAVARSAVPCFIKIAEEKPLSFAGWSAICLASEFSDLAILKINEITNGDNPTAKITLLRWITQTRKSLVTCENIRVSDLLVKMFAPTFNDANIRLEFDVCIAQLLRNKETESEAARVVRAMAGLEFDATKVFTYTFHAISKPLFTNLFTEWLMKKEVNDELLQNLIRDCVVRQNPAKLDGNTFQQGDVQEKKRLAMRLLASVHNAPCISRFIMDMAESSDKQPDGVAIAFVMLKHLVEEYPKFTADFLKNRLEEVHKDGEAFQLYSHGLGYAARYATALENLPSLKELSPTSQQRIAMHQREIRSQRVIDKIARANSVLDSLAHRVTILQGKKVATLMPDGTMSISQMAEFSYSIELPINERADPVGAFMKRLDYLNNAE